MLLLDITYLNGLNALPMKKSSTQELFPIQSHNTATTRSSIQSVLNFLQNGRCSFIFHHLICSYNHSYNPHQQSLPQFLSIFPSLFHLLTCSQNHPCNPLNISFLYTSANIHLPVFTHSTSLLCPEFSLCQLSNERGAL